MHGNVGVCTMYILYNSYIALIILFVHKKLIVNLVNDYVKHVMKIEIFDDSCYVLLT